MNVSILLRALLVALFACIPHFAFAADADWRSAEGRDPLTDKRFITVTASANLHGGSLLSFKCYLDGVDLFISGKNIDDRKTQFQGRARVDSGAVRKLILSRIPLQNAFMLKTSLSTSDDSRDFFIDSIGSSRKIVIEINEIGSFEFDTATSDNYAQYMYACAMALQGKFPPLNKTKESKSANPHPAEPNNSTSDWKRVILSQGISFEIRRSWANMSDRDQRTVESMVQQSDTWTTNGASGPTATLFSPTGAILAQLSFRFYTGNESSDVTQAYVETMDDRDIATAGAEFERGTSESAKRTNATIWGWQKTRKTQTGAFTALLSEYNGRFRSESANRRYLRARIYDGPLSFSLLVNYLESEHTNLRPDIDRILRSLEREKRQ